MERELIQPSLTKQLEPVSELQIRRNEQRGEVSVFKSQSPANDEQIAGFIRTMAAAFPAMNVDFWSVVTMTVRRRRYSYDRLLYVFETLSEMHKYPTLTLSDIIERDKVIKRISYHEHYRRYGTTIGSDGYEMVKNDEGNIEYQRIIEK